MQGLRIFKTMGLKNGKEALGLLRSMKKQGCKNIKLSSLAKDNFSVNCNLPNSSDKCSFLFDFGKNKQYQTTEFSLKVLLPWDKRHKGKVTEIANLTTGKHLKTVTKQDTFDNGVKTLNSTIIKNHVTGTTLERRITPDGKVTYYRQRENGQLEQLFA